jgi:hypothetical protein
MTLTHRDLHAILAGYPLPATYQATIGTDTPEDEEMTMQPMITVTVYDSAGRAKYTDEDGNVTTEYGFGTPDSEPEPEEQTTMISDLEARRIASEWHGGGGTALYAFTSTGAIDTAREDHRLMHEIEDCVASLATQPHTRTVDVDDLFNLRTYVSHTGKRGPQPGWSDLTW